MGSLLKPKIDMPPPPKPPPSPTSEDPNAKKEAQEKMDKASQAQRKTKGRASTIMTGGLGLEKKDDEGSISRRTLLGA